MKNPPKTPLDKFHDLNLKTPVKATIIAGVFALLVAIIQQIPSHNSNQEKSLAPPEQQAEPNKQLVHPYKFAEAVIDSLGWATDAREVLVSTKDDDLLAMMNVRIAIIRLERAKDVLQPFGESEDRAIREAVRGFNIAYGQLVLSFNESFRISERLLGGPNQREYGELISEQSKWLAQASEAWKLLVMAVAVTAHALVDNEREEDGKLPYLRITSAERGALIKTLEERFGEQVKGGLVTGQHAIEAAPAGLWQFLNQPWKPSDA